MITKFPGVEIGDGKRPKPADRPEAYRDSGSWRNIWSDHPAPSTIVVKRIGDDTPTEEYVFRTDAKRGDTDSLPRTVQAAPVKQKYNPLIDHHGTPAQKYRGNLTVKTRTLTLDEVPEAVLAVLEAKDHVEVVPTLHDE